MRWVKGDNKKHKGSRGRPLERGIIFQNDFRHLIPDEVFNDARNGELVHFDNDHDQL